MRGGAPHTCAERGAGQASPAQHLISPGVDREVKEEVQKLRSRVDVLEQVRSGLGTQGPRPAPRSAGCQGEASSILTAQGAFGLGSIQSRDSRR